MLAAGTGADAVQVQAPEEGPRHVIEGVQRLVHEEVAGSDEEEHAGHAGAADEASHERDGRGDPEGPG